jgi:hypothetical protein
MCVRVVPVDKHRYMRVRQANIRFQVGQVDRRGYMRVRQASICGR